MTPVPVVSTPLNTQTEVHFTAPRRPKSVMARRSAVAATRRVSAHLDEVRQRIPFSTPSTSGRMR